MEHIGDITEKMGNCTVPEMRESIMVLLTAYRELVEIETKEPPALPKKSLFKRNCVVVDVDARSIDAAIEKANLLKSALEEAATLADSLKR